CFCFFQAEDGIRDFHVTGVQTCALPIYPGATEEICGPELEKASGLRCGVDFKLGYSPERINPGDRDHPLEKIVKIVSGQDSESLEVIAGVYEQIIEEGVHRASSIKVAEAAKRSE